MKKNLYLVALMLVSTLGFAQVNYSTRVYDFAKNEGASQASQQNAYRASDYNDTIWFDGFEDPSMWSITGGTGSNGWIIDDTVGGGTGTWFFQNTRIQSTTGGNYAIIVPDDPNNSPTLTSATISLAHAIDISAYSNQPLVLSYEKYGARFTDTLYVEVSGDNSNWVIMDDNVDFPLLSTATFYLLPNPTSRDLFLPTSVVNSDSLYVRFRWGATGTQSAIGYGFFVDDLLLSDVPNNDLVIDQTAWFDDVRILYSWYFGAMPERQAAADTLTYSATFHNYGKSTASNALLTLDVAGQATASINSTTQTVQAGALSDTARTSSTTPGYFIANQGIGTYTMIWSITSDSVDDNPSNNKVTQEFDVTGNEYSMAPFPVSKANTVGKAGIAGSTYALTQQYFFMTADTINGLGVAFDSEWSRPGAIFTIGLIDANDVVVTEKAFVELTADMITDDMIYFPMPQTPIAAGVYEARLEVFAGDSIFVVNCEDPASPIEPTGTGTFFSRTTLSDGSSNFIESMVYLTVKNNDNITCNTTTAITGIVDDAGEIGSVTLTDVSGLGHPMYDYSWSGPNGFSATTTHIDNLDTQGTYSVTVTDIDGCTATEDFIVAGKVTVEEVSFAGSVSVFPNPNEGNFTLKMVDVAAGTYTISVRNLIGQSVYTTNVAINGGYTNNFDIANLSKGVYFLEVANNEGDKSVTKFVVK